MWARSLDRAGHDASEPSLFVCEGLLVYLDRAYLCRTAHGLAASAAATGSVLAVSLATHADGHGHGRGGDAANERRRTGDVEPWQTIFPAAEHLAMVKARAGGDGTRRVPGGGRGCEPRPPVALTAGGSAAADVADRHRADRSCFEAAQTRFFPCIGGMLRCRDWRLAVKTFAHVRARWLLSVRRCHAWK